MRSLERVTATLVIAGLSSVGACGGDDGQPTEPDPTDRQVASVTVTPGSVELDAIERTRTLLASAEDPEGDPIPGVEFVWSSSDESVATVDGAGRVTARANGTATVRAEVSGVGGTADVTVEQRIHEVVVTPAEVMFGSVGETRQLEGAALDANGHPLPGVEPAWASTDPEVVTVDATGLATARAGGEAAVRGSALELRGYARVSVEADGRTPARWRTVSAGLVNGCGVTSSITLYCWGNNAHAQMMSAATQVSQSTAVELDAGRDFDRVTAGGSHLCALTPAGRAFCWGNSTFGEGGYGSTQGVQAVATAVDGGLSFTRLVAGGNHTCGVTVDGRAWCWGRNGEGQLGDGSTTDRHTPVEVAGGLAVEAISAGPSAVENHTCALTTDGAAWCWGRNQFGELGDGTTQDRTTPVLVETDRAFTRIAAGGGHTCAVATDGSVWCWGRNFSGELGDGSTVDSPTPVRVEADPVFETITTGHNHSCGLTAAGVALCWGQNADGALGDGTTESRSAPVQVAGGHRWSHISAGPGFTCGVSVDGEAWCWGDNEDTRLGIGPSSGTTEPARVRRADEETSGLSR